MIRTRLTEQYELEHPIICAPMGLVTGGELAAAVSHAGGLGILGGGYAGTLNNEPDLKEEYRRAGNAAIGVGVITWAAQSNPELVDWIIAQRPRCLFLSFGDPTEFAEKANEVGIPVICQVQSLDHMKAALSCGASAIVVQGTEAGGHGADRSLLPFVPEVADYIAVYSPEMLVLAAGGIADGRGLAAALMLGADGVVVGTRFWATPEALTPQSMIDRAISAAGDDTIRSRSADYLRGVPWPEEFSFRTLRNRLTDEWKDREDEAKLKYASLKKTYDDARRDGNLDIALSVAGEAVGLIDNIKPAAQIVEEMTLEAERCIQAAGAKLEA